ncbi:hypothetical protein VSP10_13670 [Myroides odoratimimus]|uniref:UDP-glucose/GDP-mannose dehydrogenase N-terminal domain-containing protein n=1 Tax=Myroides odoratimimus CIP 101113 TaxID=883154 RepID=A0AAV3F1J6_9FLAO|nr:MULTISPECIES: hypothetical protein [Myroides]APA93712.1 hypothetical protein BK054_16085 [Myroides sp. ZB35]EHO09783.1 hypothetical protein HMPREF9715_02336 [Myroides odoratimimus CIP 101113]EKB05819.1 hypothetical protein HMPREF9711_00991 [Myroides odoratimimus CCUG 3837]EPH13469.1 UDP-N-acetyl-D-mannosaminuronic acid dehydrogenase [Myroides odoratimimus CCUG 12700]MEC4053831.1 hypothetical protein [Myroides odoratimimus]
MNTQVVTIGLGYIGLPTSALIAQNKIGVHGVDISQHVVDTINAGKIHIVEPNIQDHKVFKLTNYREAVEKADIVVFLVAHNEFKTLEIPQGKVVLDFCGIKK